MNKYIYKVRFLTLNVFIATTKIMHKHELIFGQQQQLQQKKLIANKSMNASGLFSQKFHFLTSDR